jgi:hypothetical protein
MKDARVLILGLIVAAAAWYLYDPPWIGGVTSGLRQWEEDPPGTRFRWTSAHAAFYIPSDATELTLPMRPLLPITDGKPVRVSISADGRWLTDVELTDAQAWMAPRVPLPHRTSRRRFRRIDLRVSRVVGFYNLGIQLREATLRSSR